MPRLLSLLLLVIAFSTSGTCAKRISSYTVLPEKYDGSMMPYNFSLTEAPEWPDSLTPVYCGYVARHGARFMTSVKKFKKLREALIKAEADNKITAKGSRLLAIMDSAIRITAGRWGELSSVGLAEERQLGADMAKIFPLLSRPGDVVTMASFVPRAIMTMYEFNHALTLNNDSLEIDANSGFRYSPLVYCFAYDKVYDRYRKHGDWKEVVKEYERRLYPITAIERLLDISGMSEEEKLDMTGEFYSFLQSQRAMGMPAPTTEWMTEEEYRACWTVSNLTHYLRNTITSLNTTCAVATAPLISAIINGADRAASATGEQTPSVPDNPVLQGWFGHAETLLPLLSTLRIPGCHALPLNLDTLTESWQLQDITPLGANFALFIFRGPSGNAYAAVRLNGRNISPVPGEGNVVKWQLLRDFWIHAAQSLGADIDISL